MSLLSLAAALLLAAPAKAGTEVYIKVAGQGSQAQLVSLFLPPFTAEDPTRGEDSLAAKRLRDVVRDDLLFSRRFDVLEDDKTPAAWRLEAKAGRSADKLTLSAKLVNLQSNETVFERYYKQDARFDRSLAHKLSDDVVQAVTGKTGIAHTRVAFANDATGHKEIYVVDYDGAGLTRVTADGSIDLLPRFSPDGKELAYTTYKDGNPDLFLLDLATGKSRPLSRDQGLNIAGGFSPDGTQMLMTLSRGKSPNLYVKSLTDGSVTQLTQHFGADSSPTFSPDGGQVAFVSDRAGNPEIFILDMTTRRVKRLTSLNWCDSPSWSPTGEWIAFAGRANPKDKLDIFLVDVTGNQIRQLTNGETSSENPSWSPDGRFLAFTRREGPGSVLYIMDADGSAPHKLGSIPGSSITPNWSE